MGNSSDICMKVWFLFTTAYEITLLYHTSFYTNHTSQAWILRNHTSEVWLKVWFHESHFYHTFKVCSHIFLHGWFRNYLSDRWQIVKYNSTYSKKKNKKMWSVSRLCAGTTAASVIYQWFDHTYSSLLLFANDTNLLFLVRILKTWNPCKQGNEMCTSMAWRQSADFEPKQK